MDRTALGLHASRGAGKFPDERYPKLKKDNMNPIKIHFKIYNFISIVTERSFLMFCDISSNPRHGQFYGTQLVLGLVTQQFQLRGIKVKKGGKYPFTLQT